MVIQDIISQCFDGRTVKREVSALLGIMVHRVGVNAQTGAVLGYDGPSICDAFLGRVHKWRGVAKVTGSQNAYTFFVGGGGGAAHNDGAIWQALPLNEIGYHARRFSRPYVGIGVIGDFRADAPSSEQWSALVDLCACLIMGLGLDATRVVGHGEIRGAHGGSKGPGQSEACPGDRLPMAQLRDEVAAVSASLTRASGFQRLIAAGGVV